jgi:hypothetical protein
MSLEEYCSTLSDKKKMELSVMLLKITLPVWDNFSEKGKLTYRDSMVWQKHTVDKDIISKVIGEAEKPEGKFEKLYNEFTDPITAIQDDDWKPPASAGKIFYSAYNLLNAILTEDGDSSKYYYTSINQSIDVIDSEKLLSEEEIKEILKEFK